jgi:hypothetical protein
MRVMRARLRVLAIAVASGRVGCVFFVSGKIRDWRLSKKAAKNVELSEKQATKWIDKFRPDVVVTEDVSKQSTKSTKTRSLISTISGVADRRKLLDVKVPQAGTSKNKYEEAKALGKRFPEIAAWVPKKPQIWEPEPRNTVYFEAIGLALQIMHDSEPDTLKG